MSIASAYEREKKENQERDGDREKQREKDWKREEEQETQGENRREVVQVGMNYEFFGKEGGDFARQVRTRRKRAREPHNQPS